MGFKCNSRFYSPIEKDKGDSDYHEDMTSNVRQDMHIASSESNRKQFDRVFDERRNSTFLQIRLIAPTPINDKSIIE
jgi:hypothetical protein